MNKPVVFATAIVAIFFAIAVKSKFDQCALEILDAKSRTLAVADEAKKTLENFNQAIQDLRSKFLKLEMSQEASQQDLMAAKSVSTQLDEMLTQLETEQARRVEAEKQAAEAKQSLSLIRDSPKRIKMHPGKGCQPCQTWKQVQQPLWKAMGWEVEILPEETTSTKPWPWFEICDGDKCYEFTGPVTLEAYAKLKAKK